MRCCHAFDVRRVGGRYHGGVEIKRGRNHERVHRMRGGHAGFLQESPGALRDRPGQIAHHDAAAAEHTIDGSVKARAPIHLGKHRSGHAHQCSALVRDLKDGTCALRENSSLTRPREGVQRFRV